MIRKGTTKNLTVRFEHEDHKHEDHNHDECNDSIVTDSSLEENSIFNKINSSDTRIKRLNTMSQGFVTMGVISSLKKKSTIDIEINLEIKNFMIKIFK